MEKCEGGQGDVGGAGGGVEGRRARVWLLFGTDVPMQRTSCVYSSHYV